MPGTSMGTDSISIDVRTSTYTGSTPDLILHSLAHFKDRGRFEATFKYQNYEVCDDWFANRRYSVQDGNQCEFRIVFDHNGSWKKVLLDEITPRNYKDSVKGGFIPWTFGEGKALYEKRRMGMQKGRSALYNYMKEQFFIAYHSIFEGLEEDAFAIPDNSADERVGWGVPYWVNFLDSGTTDYVGSFSGQTAIFGDGTTTSTIAGLSNTTHPRWRNWAFNHQGVNMSTLDAMRLAMRKTNFKPPRNLRQYYSQKTQQHRIYTSIDYAADYERLVNQNPGDGARDLNPFYGDGIIGFRGVDWRGIAVLDGKAHSPIYGLDMNNFRPIVKSDLFMVETEPMNDVDTPHLFTVQIDCQYNFGSSNRRRGLWVGHLPF